MGFNPRYLTIANTPNRVNTGVPANESKRTNSANSSVGPLPHIFVNIFPKERNPPNETAYLSSKITSIQNSVQESKEIASSVSQKAEEYFDSESKFSTEPTKYKY